MKLISTRKTPPVYGLSIGPIIVACQWNISSPIGPEYQKQRRQRDKKSNLLLDHYFGAWLIVLRALDIYDEKFFSLPALHNTGGSLCNSLSSFNIRFVAIVFVWFKGNQKLNLILIYMMINIKSLNKIRKGNKSKYKF